MSEVIVQDNPAKEQELLDANAALVEENLDLQKQNDLLVEQITGLENRYNQDRARWNKYKAEVLADNEALEKRNMALENAEEKYRKAQAQEYSRRVSTIPKFVFAALLALMGMGVAYILQKLCVIGPSAGFGLQCLMAMVISWCYATIVERARK